MTEYVHPTRASTEAPPRVAAATIGRSVRIGAREAHWEIAVEAPVEVTVNGEPWTVLLATPRNLEDLAVGLAVTEGVLRDVSGVDAVDMATFLHDVRVDLRVAEWAIDQSARRPRTLMSGTACGLCGIESLAQLQSRRPPRVVARGADGADAVGDAAIRRALADLPAWQPMNAASHSVHAAAWCALDGAIRLAREDIGRHNALDKLVGALARAGRLAEPGFVLMTSRCSYELVAKVAVTGAVLLATVSAPTSLALTWASTLALSLVATQRREGNVEIVRFPSAADTDGE